MKGLLSVLLFIVFSNGLIALPLGNPADAGLLTTGVISPCYGPELAPLSYRFLSFRFGFYGDYVFNRKIESTLSHKEVHQTKVNTNAGFFALNVCNRIDLFSSLGASNFTMITPRRSIAFPVGGDTLEIATATGLSWSLGLRGTLFEWRCLTVGLEGQYFRTKPRLNYSDEMSFINAAIENPNYYNERLLYYEWQVGLGAAYTVNIYSDSAAFIPYAGLTISKARIDTGNVEIRSGNDTFALADLQSDRYCGYAIGITAKAFNAWSATVEGRFINETALYVNTQIRF